MTSTVGVIANPRSGKDIRRLVAHAPAPSDTSRIADIRRLVVGAVEGGAERLLVALDAHGLAERAVDGLAVNVELIDVDVQGNGDDTARAAAEMRSMGAGVLAVYGGDGTHRDVCRGWRDAPIVAISGGTNNAFPQLIEPTVAGAAAGLAVAGGVPLEDLIAYQSLVLDIDVEGIPSDLALVDVAVIRGDTGGGPSLWSVDGVEQIFTAVAEPWSVGLSALAGLVAPTSRTDDRGVLLDLDPDAPQRVRAPIAPGHYVEAGLRSVSVVDAEQPVAVRGPAVFAVDGERAGSLATDEWGSMTLRRTGPRVIDIRRTFSLAVRRGHFYTEQTKGSCAMAQEFTMPKLGLTMTDGTIREWLVADGTMVQAGEAVLIIETDKVETEVEARESGILSLTGEVGENYECGAVIGYLLEEGEQGAATAAPAPEAAEAPIVSATPAPEAPPAAPAPVPQAPVPVAPTVPTADVATRGEGNRILASPMARAAARNLGVELAPITGTGPKGRIVADDVASYAEQLAAVAASVPAASSNGAATGEGGRLLASPRARATARELDIDLAGVSGTGPGGRIVAADVTEFASRPSPAAAAPAAANVPAAAAKVSAPAAGVPAGSGVAATGGARMLAELLGIDLRAVPAAALGARVTREDVAAWVRVQLALGDPIDASPSPVLAGEEPAPTPQVPLLQEPSKVIPLRGMRGVIAERMHSSLTEMAQLTLNIDADMTAVSAERERRKNAELIVPGYTAWVVAAASRALVDHPYVNSQVTADGVALLPQVHLGVAVALDEGLIVPVIEDANTRGVAELHRVVADLAGRARDAKLKLDELEGGTFSVTALGMYGVDGFTPVINPPNTAILGVGRLRTETRWNDGVPSPKTVMTLSLTWDHRAFDGAPAAEFAQSIVRYLENPALLGE